MEPRLGEGRRTVMATTLIHGGSPRDKMWGLLVLGLALQVAGCVTAVVQAPDTELGTAGPVETGDRTLMLMGVLTFGLGGVLSLIAVIAFGVLLGMRAHEQSRPGTSSSREPTP
jgi:hypothetical protein